MGVPIVDDPAILQSDDPLGLNGDRIVVGDEHHGIARVVELLQHGEDFPAGVGIQCAGGLICQDNGRLPHQSPGDGRPLLLSAGELAGLVLDLVTQSYLIQCHLCPLTPLIFRYSGVHQRYLYILQQVQLRQQIVLLENKAQHLVPNLRQFIFIHGSHILTSQ